MHKDVETGRKAIAQSFDNLLEVHKNYPVSFNMRVFFDAKSSEIIKIFEEGSREEKQKVVEILTKIDPANILKYQEIM
jgi:hypothetical protein